MNLSQQGLAERAGVSLGSLKRFERTGEIAFVSLLRLADVLEATAEFQQLFPPKEVRSLDDLLTQQPQRQRGRRT